MVANQSWLGISLNYFSNAEEKTSEGSSFELLKEGFYRATVKNAYKSVIGSNNRPAFTVVFTLDDFSNKEINHIIYLEEDTDDETKKINKKNNLRNFFSRFVYRNITKSEYDKFSTKEVNDTIQELCVKNQPTFTGAKMLVDIKQEPFVSRDRDTKAIKWTDKPFNANICTKPILKVIQELQKSGVEVDKFPVILFSNKIAFNGCGFYNDYNENAKLKNSPSYDFIQSLNTTKSDDVIDEPEIPW